MSFACRSPGTGAIAVGWTRIPLLVLGACALAVADTHGATGTAVEYFHAELGHYFVTAYPDEARTLDDGTTIKGWTRTGYAFSVATDASGGDLPVCRFFSAAFAPKSSHFYTADPVECAGLKANPAWQYEKIAFYIAAPKGQVCLGGDVPVLRLYNDGMTGAPNHRFTESQAIYDDFVANQHWTPEGVRFCAPL